MVALLLLGIFQMAAAGGAEAPPPGTVRIVGVSSNGNGCPPGSTEVILSSDLLAITAIFSKYTASTPGAVAERRKSCTLSVDLVYPTGFSYAVATVTYRGYAQLEKGVVGTLAASYYFSGVPGTVKTLRKLPSPINDNFEYTDKFVTLAYTPCDLKAPRNLNLKSEIRVTPSKSSSKAAGLITVDSKDLSLKQIFSLTWEKC
ncbi:hypothetical protein CBR_g9213 [Chara braunii]|uniref:DUF4360 domain-containing protein n=1 Tax=Chara braunii TaxID=69332 RepID=A0A388KP29_CHABU|nr:hypothetical protein CBR_g9213 [Chara braunii]|eukprot:GBG71804.1 hypothetical protein CBR_g9213 [Chara braunii]